MTDSHETNHAAASGHRHADGVRPTALCAEAWFDMYPAASLLRISISTPFQENQFWVPVKLANTIAWVNFTFLAFIKGQKMFEASGICLECDPRPTLQSPMFRLSGLHQGGLQVVS